VDELGELLELFELNKVLIWLLVPFIMTAAIPAPMPTPPIVNPKRADTIVTFFMRLY
jgi:hypothetical protein